MLAARFVPWETRNVESNPMLEKVQLVKNPKYLPQVFMQVAKAANHLLGRTRIL